MDDVDFRIVSDFPEPAFSGLWREAFAGHEASGLLTGVLAGEEATPGKAATDAGKLRIGCFRGENLVAWTYARPVGARELSMVNSGVAAAERRAGLYSRLVAMVIDHASSRGYVSISSRHTASNNAVIIAKLKLGFFVSGFEYSEVYGPLVRLTYLIGELRRTLHQSRARPIRPLHDGEA